MISIIGGRSFGKTRKLLEQKDKLISDIEYQRDYWKMSFKHENLISEERLNDLEKVRKELKILDNQIANLSITNKKYYEELLNKTKEIEELENKLKYSEKYNLELSTRNKTLTNDYLRLFYKFGVYEKEIIKDYLMKKRDLLDDQNAPIPLRQLIYNLIQELKNE